jgi:prepilin-type N-terminal cleavage/methylation domain-containing protein
LRVADLWALLSSSKNNFLYTKSFKYSIIIASSKAIMNLWVLDYRMKGIYEMKKGAFTLAEVLLTLAIIGVVAAMTVPSLMTSTEDKKLGAAAKKAYNEASIGIDSFSIEDMVNTVETFVDANVNLNHLRSGGKEKLSATRELAVITRYEGLTWIKHGLYTF